MTWSKLRHFLGPIAFALLLVYGAVAGLTGSPLLETAPAAAQKGGAVPGNFSGNLSDAELWRAIRKGVQGRSDMQDPQAGVLVQSQGDNWRAFKNGPLSQFGGWLLLAAIVVLGLFRALRGQVKIDEGPSGQTIERFNQIERAAHWLLASSFIYLALTGLNLSYGRYWLLPLIGPETFSTLTYYGKITHNYVAFAFMAGLISIFVLWVRDNILDGSDLPWILAGGGLLWKGSHPPAKKFNFGQKVIFWIVIFGGVSLAWSGLSLVFSSVIAPWGVTFGFLNIFGFGLPTDLTPLQEVQLSVLWHSITSTIMVAVIIAHIYIGTTLGMEGAIGAVSDGQVDVNWLKEHHSLWAEEIGVIGSSSHTGGGEQPAE
ncbi:MAG: formate dehydrogenase subunit gamma [Rhodospirillales bacterium]|nr:formate dehydrogenase subunit gamma [Alphaproteobacteria bacterium]MBL6948300.1 formate dehydrogenase subunit gamma [Rhodospirillales bacterium]